MLKKISIFITAISMWHLSNAQIGVNANFDAHYSFSNNFNRKQGGSASNGGGVNFVTDRNSAGLGAIQLTTENGVVVSANSNRAYTGDGFTFAAWINPANFTMNPGICTGVGTFNNTFATRMIVEAANTVAPFDKDFRVYLQNGKVTTELNTSSSGLITWTSNNGQSPVLNQWQHIAVTFTTRSNQGVLKFYLNGVVQDSSVYTNPGNVVVTGKAMEFGTTNIVGSANCGNYFQAFQGALDEFRFYSSGLLASDIKAIYDEERVYSNLEVNSLLNNQFAYYPINNDFQDYVNPAQATYNIQKIVPTTYTSQPLGSNRANVANSSITQGATGPSASTNFNGYRIPSGNQYIKPDSTFTMALWVKNTGTTWNNTTLVDATNGVAANYKWIVNNTGNVVVYLGSTMFTFPSQNMPLNTWLHLAVSMDGKNKVMKLYINGQLADTYNAGIRFKVPASNSGDIFFMTSTMYFQNGYWQGGGSGLVGNMDEIRFFGKALTESEVRQVVSPSGKLKQKILAKTIVYGTISGSTDANIYGGSSTPNTYTIGDNTVAVIDPVNNGISSLKAGITTIRVQNAGDANFLAVDTTVALTISKRDLLYQVNSYTRPYGDVNPVLELLYSNQNANTGFVNGETASAVKGTAVVSTTATVNSPVGSYPVTYQAGSLTADNYNIVAANGTLNITKGNPVVTLVNNKITYGDTMQVVSAKVGILDVPVTISGGSPYLSVINGTANAKGIERGNAVVSYNVTGTANYNGINSGYNVSVVAAPLTMVVKNQTVQLGQEVSSYYDMFNTNNPYEITGMKNGEEYYNGLLGFIQLTATGYDPDNSSRGNFPLTYIKPDPNSASGSNYYIANVVDATLTVTGKRKQGLEYSCSGGKREEAKGGCACPDVFPDKIVTDAPYTISNNLVKSYNYYTGNYSGEQIKYSIVSGPATVSGNTISLTGTTGTVTINMYLDESNDNEAIAQGLPEYTYCFQVTGQTTAIEDGTLSSQNGFVYPNPAQTVINFSGYAELFDLLGNKVAVGTSTINIEGLNVGVYSLRTQTKTVKIVKE